MRGSAICRAVLALALLAGCGVSLQDQAESLPVGAIPTASPAPVVTPTSAQSTLFFVAGPQLKGIQQPIADQSAESVMTALAVGPGSDDGAELRTLLLDPLTSQPMLAVTGDIPGGQVVVTTTPAYFQMGPGDQRLLVGQVVMSMDAIGRSSVLVTDPTGNQIGISLPDGVTREGPATATDYEVLVDGG